MISYINRRYIFSLFFFIYFIPYSISPLSYTYTYAPENIAENGPISGRIPFFGRNVHILLWELIYAKFVPKEDISHAHSTEMVIVKKTRAIMPENTISKAMPYEDVFVPGFLKADNALLRLAVKCNTYGTSIGYHLYSTHSPPFV